jgi:hypothetical protein
MVGFRSPGREILGQIFPEGRQMVQGQLVTRKILPNDRNQANELTSIARFCGVSAFFK